MNLTHMRAGAFVLGLALPALAFADGNVMLNQTIGTIGPACCFVIYDAAGKAVFTVDAEKRAIIVPDDVDADETARLVIDMMAPHFLRAVGDANLLRAVGDANLLRAVGDANLLRAVGDAK